MGKTKVTSIHLRQYKTQLTPSGIAVLEDANFDSHLTLKWQAIYTIEKKTAMT